MLFGILAHGSTINPVDEGMFLVVRTVSDLFRMATFFLIAGFFTAMVATKAHGRDYLTGRARLILVPLVTTLVTLVPITNYLIHIWHNGPMTLRHYFLEGGWNEASAGQDVWHLHLWFLFALFAYAVVTPALLGVLRRPRVSALIDRYVARTGRWTLWVTAFCVAIAVLVLRTFYNQALAPVVGGTRIAFLVSATLNYLPYYTLGMIMFFSRDLFTAMHRISLVGIALCAALYLGAVYGGEGMPFVVNRMMLWIGKGGSIVFIIAALLRLFEMNFNKPSRALSFLVDSAFTFYLFHLTGIFIVANLIGPSLDNLVLTFLVIVAVVPPVVLLIHAWVVAPSSVLRFLYNGKPLHRAAAPAVV